MMARRAKWSSSMISDRMGYLREDGGKLVKDVAPHRLGEAVPDALGSDEHASTPLFSARVISSRMASRVSLLVTASYGRDARLVAAIGSLSRIWSRKTTRTLSLPLVLGLLAVSMNFGPLVLTNSGPPPVIKSAEPGRGQAQQVGVGSL